MNGARFEVFQDRAGAWRWRLVAANSRIVAVGEAHTREADALRAARTVVRVAPGAQLVAPSLAVKAARR